MISLRLRSALSLSILATGAFVACNNEDAKPALPAITDGAVADTPKPDASNLGSDRDGGTHAAPATADASSGAVGQSSAADAASASDATQDASTASPEPMQLDTDYGAFQAKLAKLRSCGIVNQGVFPFDPQLDLRCASLCVLAASCKDLETEACDERAVDSLESCFDLCTEDDVSCGGGVTAPNRALCDLRPDCPTGEDEMHCETVACKNGDVISSANACDGIPDCEDGSDEVGCALVCGKARVMNF
ncbi:MAG: basement rane-specific heparan sulfate proteoglycan core protein-like isoform [Myxococcaceae bacterium]|nr:basement rane-specific heparan sulfate proteoglycan core protein-like isoform [Myxococcaceae bacterium]